MREREIERERERVRERERFNDVGRNYALEKAKHLHDCLNEIQSEYKKDNRSLYVHSLSHDYANV